MKGEKKKAVSEQRSWHRWFSMRNLIIVISIVIAYYIVHHYTHSSKTEAPKTIVVETAVAKLGNAPIYLPALGTVTADNIVPMKAQVTGQLLKLVFADGQYVKKGDLLAEVDSKPYAAQVQQAEGQLTRDTALLQNARLDLQRYQSLWKADSVSKQVLDAQASLVKQYEGTVQLDRGTLEQARVNLVYCKIVAPLDGRMGISPVSEGVILQVGDTVGLLNTISPIDVLFSVSESVLPQLLQTTKDNPDLEVQIYDKEQEKLLVTGKLSAIDNQIDTTTGMVQLKAQFPNEDGSLFPNQFVNVKLLLDTMENVLLVPTAAIQHSPNKDFVYKVEGQKVHMVTVTTGITAGENTVIAAGLSAGQVVVTTGTDKLTDGAAVSFNTGSKQPATTDKSDKSGKPGKP